MGLTSMVSLKKVTEVDNKITYLLLYRNVYNIAVLFVAFMADAMKSSPIIVIVLLVLGLKWTLSQIRENSDALEIMNLQK